MVHNETDAAFRLLFEENPTPMYLMECQSFRIIKVNDALCRITGDDQETAATRTNADYQPESSSASRANQIRREALSGQLVGPEQFLCRNRGTFPAMIMRRLIKFGGDDAIISTLWDISELEAARSQARESMRRLERITATLETRTKELSNAQRLAKIGSWQWNLGQRNVIFAPETWLLVGRPVSDAPVSYEELRSMFHPDDYQAAMDTYYRAIEKKAPVSAEYRIVTPDGANHHVLTYAEPIIQEDGTVIGLCGTTQDVTDIRSVEMKLRASEDHYRHMVDLHPQIPWTADPDGSLIDTGAKWFAMTGMTAEETFPHGWTKAIHPDDVSLVRSEWGRCLQTLLPLDIECRIRDVRNEFVWLRARAAVRRDQAGCPVRWYGTMEDITDRKNAEEARWKSEILAAQVLNATSDAVLVLSPDYKIRFSNVAARKLFGDPVSRAHQTLHGLLKIRKTNDLITKIRENYRLQRADDIEFFWKTSDIWFEIRIKLDEQKISLFVRDVSAQKRAQRQLEYAARHDALTGAPNRVELFDQLAYRLKDSPNSERVALMCLDLDFFKEVNDQLGHPAGDALLKLVVIRVRSCIRSNDLIARTGGDEFMILQTGVRSYHDVELLAERLISAIKNPFEIEGRNVQVGVSIGIAVSHRSDENHNEMYKQADIALYSVKASNRGGYRFYDHTVDDEFQRLRDFRSDLGGALLREEFSLVFQPIFRTADETIIGAEALLRWKHPLRGDVPPGNFIPVAEESGYIIEIGNWVLQESCRAARLWPENMVLSVNVSPKQIEHGRFVATVGEVLQKYDMRPGRLLLEVTESAFFSANENVKDTIRALSALGVYMVLDDFGIGYSSLSYLDTFDFSRIKVDRSFIVKISESTKPMAILDAIMGLGQGLGLTVTAEGVETRTQLEYLKRIGCHEVQGFLLGRPMSNDELMSRISRPAAVNVAGALA